MEGEKCCCLFLHRPQLYCLLRCETCESGSGIALDPLNLYSAKCFSCRNEVTFANKSKYTVRYDRIRHRCHVCEKGDSGCYFRKRKEIYAECLTMQADIGKGTPSQPLNFNRISEVDIDSIILSDEADLKVAIIYYNEL